MQKTIVFSCVAVILLLGVVGVMAAGGIMVTAGETVVPTENTLTETVEPFVFDTDFLIGMSYEEAEPYIQQMEETKKEWRKATGTYVEPEMPLLYRCYAMATEEQKAELDAFQGPFELKDIAVYPRKTQEIVGLLPADAPRLTLEQAEAILQKMLDEGDASYDRACLAFREIAEVDYEGGSGLAFTHFCLNDAMTQSVVVHYSGVDYHDSQEGILIELVSFATEEFTSVLAMMEQGEIPPVRADSAE